MWLKLKDGEEIQSQGFHSRELADGSLCLIWARGYFFDASGQMHKDEEIVDWLASTLDDRPLGTWIPAMNGCFSIVVVRDIPVSVEIGVDRFGLYPIYYCQSANDLVLGEDFWQVAEHVTAIEYDFTAVASMLLLGYVSGYRTLLDGVRELEQASTHNFSFTEDHWHVDSKRYWQMSYRHDNYGTSRSWRAELTEVLSSIFSRYAQAALERGWHVRIPLSGGKDSRLIAAMYRQSGLPVWAFSYGPAEDVETQIAEKVADFLQIPLDVTIITDSSVINSELIHLMTRRVGMQTRFTGGLGAQLSLCSYSDNDLYVPGHSGGLVSGNQLSRGGLAVRSRQQAIRHLMNAHLLPLFDDTLKVIFGQGWRPELKQEIVTEPWVFNPDDPNGSLDRWDCENRQRRLILSEMRTYAVFGNWMLPFYDYVLFDFFRGVPLRLRYQEPLYIESLGQGVFTDELAPLARIPLAGYGDLRTAYLSWRDRALMLNQSKALSEWVLRRATASKRREHEKSVGQRPQSPTGADPIDWWWYQSASFRQTVSRFLETWDGMGGIIDVTGLRSVLSSPQPRLFVRFAIPALLTMRTFQTLVGTRHET